MAADTTSIFYQIGQATKQRIADDITALKAANNTWTGTNDFQNNVTVGTTTQARNFKVYGVAETTSDLTVGGNLTVNGTTTTLSTSTLEVEDNFVHLSKGASAGSYNNDSGLYFERGTGEDATAFVWDESEDKFVLGSLPSVASSTETTTFSSLPAQVASSGSSSTIDIDVSQALGYTSSAQGAGGGTANTPYNLYVFSGDPQGKSITNGTTTSSLASVFNTSGVYIWTYMNMSNGQTDTAYSVLYVLLSGDTMADITTSDIHVWDDQQGGFVTENGNFYYTSDDSIGDLVSDTPSYYQSGGSTNIFSLTYSDGTATIAQDVNPVSFSTDGYPETAQVTVPGSVSFSSGSYDVTFLVKGQLASDVDTVEIVEQTGGSTVQGGNGTTSPFVISGNKLTYYLDSSNQSANTFAKLTSDVASLEYSSAYSDNGGYYVGGGSANIVLEVSYNSAPGSADYIDIPNTVTQSLSASPNVTTAPTDATANVTPGALGVGTLSLVDQTDGQLNLGDLTDFEAGIA